MIPPFLQIGLATEISNLSSIPRLERRILDLISILTQAPELLLNAQLPPLCTERERERAHTHARIHIHTHARTHTHTQAHTHTHTHTPKLDSKSFVHTHPNDLRHTLKRTNMADTHSHTPFEWFVE